MVEVPSRSIPPAVTAALREASRLRFEHSCSEAVGRLLAAVASSVLAHDPRVRVLKGDWRLLEALAPYDVFFCDGGGKREDPAGVVRMLASGGVLVLDDFTPALPGEPAWPPTYRGAVDTLRIRYLTDPALVAVELSVGGGSGVVLATRH